MSDDPLFIKSGGKPNVKIKIKKNSSDKEIIDYMIELESSDSYKTNKTNIDKIILDKKNLFIINDLVNRTNKLVTHAYQFLKLYLIHLYETNKPFPKITKVLLSYIFCVLSERSSNKGNRDHIYNEEKESILNFYNDHYFDVMCGYDPIMYDNLTYILAYEKITMITCIENNIKEHFISRLYKYINIILNVSNRHKIISEGIYSDDEKLILHKELNTEIYTFKKDITTFDTPQSNLEFHDKIKALRISLYGSKKSFIKKNIIYDIKSKPQEYLKGMFFINNELDKINKQNYDIELMKEEKDRKYKEIRLFNVLPLRLSISPKNITIDTNSLIWNFYDNCKYHADLYEVNKLYGKELWGNIFNLKNKVFKKNKTSKKYVFHNMIRTDGISCSVVFVKTDKEGKPLNKKYLDKPNKEILNTDYIENTVFDDKLNNMKIVCIDPGHSDLIYCGSKDLDDKLETFRYTQNQRRVETKKKRYRKIIYKINKKTIIKGKTIKEHESELSTSNKKFSTYSEFKSYCTDKNKLNETLYNHYEQKVFRKLKLNNFINTQKSESKMINNFKTKFGGPEKVIVIIGDYDKGSYHMQGLEPAICKKFRRLFKNAGYIVKLINEFRTSKLCNGCNSELEKFHWVLNKKPKHKNKQQPIKVLCHGLLRCQSVKHNCKVIHNRDKNAVQNMLKIVESIKTTGSRPIIFTRTSIVLDS